MERYPLSSRLRDEYRWCLRKESVTRLNQVLMFARLKKHSTYHHLLVSIIDVRFIVTYCLDLLVFDMSAKHFSPILIVLLLLEIEKSTIVTFLLNCMQIFWLTHISVNLACFFQKTQEVMVLYPIYV